MTREPQIQTRAAQPYVSIPATVTMAAIGAAVDSGFPELFGWLASQGIAPAGVGPVEFYLTDPSQAPDPATWQTDLAYLTS